MKVGILTFHEGLNHGAYLQAYCTMQAVRQLEHDPVIINYKNRTHWIQEDVRPWLAYRRPVRFLDRFQKQRAFSRDHKAMPLTGYTHDPDEVRKWHFDAVIVGSDVVWDTSIFGFDSLYFGDLNTDRLIAYAASCGSYDFTGNMDSKIAEGIRSFDFVSVRDQNTSKLVEAVTGECPERVLDPVFLPDSLDGFTSDEPPLDFPYVLVYGGRFSPADGEHILDWAAQRQLQVISVGYRNHWAPKNIMSVGPLSILNYFKHAAFIVSGTFHGTVFSLRFRKNFIVVLNESIRNKATCLLDAVGCPERAGNTVASVLNKANCPPDYVAVDQRISDLRSSSLEFLSNALAGEERA